MSSNKELRKKELLSSSPFLYGIAVSNMANETNPHFTLPDNLPTLFSYLAKEQIGAELQIESIDIREIPFVEKNRLPFLGVHLPIRDINLLNQEQRERSLKTDLLTFDFARNINADYAVIHMLTHEEWDRLSERDDMIERSKQDFFQLAQQANIQGFEGYILFENLEFPLYPATRDEIVDCVSWFRDIRDDYGYNVGLAFDISHLWHTGKMLDINRYKGDVIADKLQDPFVNLSVTFEEYLALLLDRVADEIQLIHLTESRGHETHRMPSVSEKPIRTAHEALDLHASMSVLEKYLTKRNDIWTINEAHHYSYEQMVDASKKIQKIF